MSQSRTESFGEQLQRFRARAGLTQDGLARRAGVSAPTISALERGTRRLPYLHTRQRLATALGLSAEEEASFAGPRSLGTRSGAASPHPPTPALGNLPAQRTPLIGREPQVAELCELSLYDPSRLITLTGVGGCGKTRLALEVAAEVQTAFRDGAWLVELAPVADPVLVPQAIATALDVPETAGVPLDDMLTVFLRSRSILLVLDNCEHVIDACAQLVEQLLSRCPTLRILATSREPLQIAGERQRRVPMLAVPDPDLPVTAGELADYTAVQLFVARAQAVVPNFTVTDTNATTIARICTELDGIPLALELAAARVRVLSVEQVLARLDDSIRLLTGGSRAAPSRQQTLRAALDWSHDLLTAAERVAFRRMAVFAGGCDLDAVEAVVGPEPADEGSMLDLLTRLVDKSLAHVEEGSGPARYRLLEPVRQYADQRLTDGGEASLVRTRHLCTYLELAERAAPELRGPDQVAWLHRLDGEQGNFRAALSWAQACGDVKAGLRLATALTPFWAARGHLTEGRRWVTSALESAEQRGAPAALCAHALIAAGILAQWHSDLDHAATCLERSLTLARAEDDSEAIAESLTWLGVVYRRRQQFARATEVLEQSLTLYRALGDVRGIAYALSNLGTTLLNAGEVGRGRTVIESSLPLFREAGDLRYLAMTQTMFGSILTYERDFVGANAILREGLAGHLAVGDRSFIVESLRQFAALASQNQPKRAARLLAASESLRSALGAALAPLNRRTNEHILETIRASLSEPDVSAAWSAGSALTTDEAVAEALATGPSTAMPRPRRPRPFESEAPALTRREAEVARLLALGQSDREIAAALGISPRTAGVHVQNLLGKLGIRSRWQVAECLTELEVLAQRGE